MVVEDHLGLDGRIVPNRQGAVGLSGAQRRASFRDGRGPAHTVIRHTDIRPLQSVTNADVAQDVVGHRPQEPHGVHGGGELAAKDAQISVRRGEEREKLVLVPVAAAPGADKDAGAVIDRRQRPRGPAPRGSRRILNRRGPGRPRTARGDRSAGAACGACDPPSGRAGPNPAISPARDVGQPDTSAAGWAESRIGQSTPASQISSGDLPAAQMAPLPATSTRALMRRPHPDSSGRGSYWSRRSRKNWRGRPGFAATRG